MKKAILEGDLGSYLRIARENAGLSQGDVAKKLKMTQFQSISQWERNASGSVPVKTLLKLVEIYGVPLEELYDVLLKYQAQRMEEKLELKFFGKSKKNHAG
ncbi:MAG: helix-turn-helix domain-containing protein [Bdellovibrionales bacterium]|nr:helix-turn-helix domain-containing protein [Bdellovibrionales bacterium]